MPKLNDGITVKVRAGRPVNAKTGHDWEAFRSGKLIGQGWTPGSALEAFQDALDDLQLLGLTTD